MHITRHVTAAVVVLAVLSSCSSDSAATAPSGKPLIAAALYPIEELVRSVGGGAVDIFTLVPPGQEAHDYEPTAQQVGKLQQAQVVFYLGDGFQPDVEKAVASLPDSVRKIDLLKSVNLLLTGGKDPHVWLDPQNMITMAKVVAQTLDTDATDYVDQLRLLDQSFSDGLADCRSHVIVTSHRAFEYLSHRYGLTQIPIAGISPTEEPSAKTLEAVAKAARADDVTTIYFEKGVPADLARTVADEIGAKTAVLDPLESLSSDQIDAGATYISVMTEDLATLRAGLGCT
jgi:zinc transport system substrate-binding protein